MTTPYSDEQIVEACAVHAHNAMAVYKALRRSKTPGWFELTDDQRENVRAHVLQCLDGGLPLPADADQERKLEAGLFMMAVTAMYATCHQTVLVEELHEVHVDLGEHPKTDPSELAHTEDPEGADESESEEELEGHDVN